MKKAGQGVLMAEAPKKEAILVDMCPKCGGKPEGVEIFCKHRVRCQACGHAGRWRLTLKEAIIDWNKEQEDG